MTCEELQNALNAVQATIAPLTAARDSAAAVATASAAAASAAMIQASQDAQAASQAQAALDTALGACQMYTSQLQMQNCPGYGA